MAKIEKLIADWFRRNRPDLAHRLITLAKRPAYDADCLRVWKKGTEFLREPRFQRAYQRGMDSGHKIGRKPGSKDDIHIEWRVHTICWAASQAARLEGDFVECGVNTGMFSLALADYIDFNSTGKHLYLFDTYAGIPDEQINPRERETGRGEQNALSYEECYETARKNFAPYPKAILVRGRIPESLSTVSIDKVCYLSLDLNCADPEIAALRFFWNKLTPGAPVVLDDYGWSDYIEQKNAMDAFAKEVNCPILTLPTGQGLIIKPPK